MRCIVWFSILFTLLFCICGQGICGQLTGELIEVKNGRVTARFPAPVEPRSMMIVKSGVGDSVAGAAISEICTGNDGPYIVRGKVSFVAKAEAFIAGKEIYVDSSNAGVAPTKLNVAQSTDPASIPSTSPPSNDLRLYYYAAGENVGYGALGVGYDRTLRVTRGVAVELDGGITAVGNVSASNADVVNTDQLIKSLNGRLKLDFTRAFGFYSGYRWSEGRGDQDHWNNLSDKLQGRDFLAVSDHDLGTVQLQGLEYGLTLRPIGKMSLSMGYIPQYRADFGSFGVLSEPAYTGELRFGMGTGALRLRGVKSESYWQADFGVTIR